MYRALPVTGGLGPLRLSSDACKRARERLIVECFNNNGHAAVNDTSTSLIQMSGGSESPMFP